MSVGRPDVYNAADQRCLPPLSDLGPDVPLAQSQQPSRLPLNWALHPTTETVCNTGPEAIGNGSQLSYAVSALARASCRQEFDLVCNPAPLPSFESQRAPSVSACGLRDAHLCWVLLQRKRKDAPL